MSWEMFDETQWDEEGYIFCDSCGVKNRNDDGWYRRDRPYNCHFEAMKKRCLELYPEMRAIQRKEYQCDDCWKENHPKPRRCCSKCKQPGHTKNKCSS